MRCGVGDCEGGCRMLAQGYRVSHLAAPLWVRERLIGALCVGSTAQGQFAEEMQPQSGLPLCSIPP